MHLDEDQHVGDEARADAELVDHGLDLGRGLHLIKVDVGRVAVVAGGVRDLCTNGIRKQRREWSRERA